MHVGLSQQHRWLCIGKYTSRGVYLFSLWTLHDVTVYQEKQKVTGTVRDGCTLILIYLTKAAIYQMLVMLSSMLVLAGTGIVGSTLKNVPLVDFSINF